MAAGGALSYGFREGYLSQHLAQFALSKFGPVIQVPQYEDHGVDLLCNLASRVGRRLLVGGAYSVQVKSVGEKFEYTGDHAFEWFLGFDNPFFLCLVDKEALELRLYSTWNLNRLLLPLQYEAREKRPKSIAFELSETDRHSLQEPNLGQGVVPVGWPIAQFSLDELSDSGAVTRYSALMEEWTQFDRRNHLYRRAGIPVVFGYTNWQTNSAPSSAPTPWYKPYFFSPQSVDRAKRGPLTELLGMLGLYLVNTIRSEEMPIDVKSRARIEYSSLSNYVLAHCAFDSYVANLFRPEKQGINLADIK